MLRRLQFVCGLLGACAWFGVSALEIPALDDPDGTIVRVEYYFDEDPGFGAGVEIPVSLDADGKATVDVKPDLSGLASGYHRLYVRSLNQRGDWSVAAVHAFHLYPFAITTESKLERLEYYLGEDPGLGEGTEIPMDADVTAHMSLENTGPLEQSHGRVDFVIRAMDQYGNWSMPTRLPVAVTPFGFAEVPSLVTAEYFIGDDPGQGQGIPVMIPSGSGSAANLEFEVSDLASGHQSVGFRVQDSNGNWSGPTFTRMFKMPEIPATQINWSVLEGETIVASGVEPVSPPSVAFTQPVMTDILGEGSLIGRELTLQANLVLVDKIDTVPAMTTFGIEAIFDPVMITGHPRAASVFEGNSVTFTVDATGTGPFEYQWLKDGQDIFGATDATLTIAAPAIEDSGAYQVIVSNEVGARISDVAALSVSEEPVVDPVQIVTQPRGATVLEGQTLTLSVEATGTGPLLYRWLKDGSFVSGASSATLTIASATLSDTGSYQVTVANEVGEVTSSAAVVTVEAATSDIGAHPADTNGDFVMSISEVTAYGAAWKKGDPWSVEPFEIPIGYLTRAGALWKGGERYEVDDSVMEAPLWWVNILSDVGLQSIASDGGVSSVERVVVEEDGVIEVTLHVDPLFSTIAHAIEESTPAGCELDSVSEGGAYDERSDSVRWGPYFDNQPHDVSYTLVPSNGQETDLAFSGLASFDGEDAAVAGMTRRYAPHSGDEGSHLIRGVSHEGLTLSGPAGSTLIIESVEDLSLGGWNAVSAIELNGGEIQWRDPRGFGPEARFYRASIE